MNQHQHDRLIPVRLERVAGLSGNRTSITKKEGKCPPLTTVCEWQGLPENRHTNPDSLYTQVGL